MYARVYPSLATRTRFNKPEIPKPFNLFLSKIRNKDSSGNRRTLASCARVLCTNLRHVSKVFEEQTVQNAFNVLFFNRRKHIKFAHIGQLWRLLLDINSNENHKKTASIERSLPRTSLISASFLFSIFCIQPESVKDGDFSHFPYIL